MNEKLWRPSFFSSAVIVQVERNDLALDPAMVGMTTATDDTQWGSVSSTWTATKCDFPAYSTYSMNDENIRLQPQKSGDEVFTHGKLLYNLALCIFYEKYLTGLVQAPFC